jgi:hypothetical protein
VHEDGAEEREDITDGIGDEAARDERPLLNKRLTATLLYEEDQDVQGDQGVRDNGNGPSRGIVVTDGEHRGLLSV